MASNFWNYEYIPEIAELAVPKEQQDVAYNKWLESPSKESMNSIIRMFGKLMNSEVARYQGTLDRPLLTSFAKKYITDAIRSYDPKGGAQLSTHIVNQLQRLHRLNYRNVQGLRASEEVQSNINKYQQAASELLEETNQTPEIKDLAKRMDVPMGLIKKIQSQMKYEKGPAEMSREHMYTETGPEDEAADLVYYSLPDNHKKIFEWKTGYNNAPIMKNKDIAVKLNISPVRVTQISESIADKIKEHLGQGYRK